MFKQVQMYKKVVHYTPKLLFVFLAPDIFPSIFLAFHHLSLLLFPFHFSFPLFFSLFSLSFLLSSFSLSLSFILFFSHYLLLSFLFFLFSFSSFPLLSSFSTNLSLTSSQHKVKAWPNFTNVWDCKSK